MYRHHAYGLNIYSEISLLGTLHNFASADVTVSIGSVKRVVDKHISGNLCGELENIGRVLISNGTSIVIDPLEGVSNEMIAPNILGGCMSIILRQRGYLALHASSVAMQNIAVAFLGGSGWGKSTLAAALHAEGHNVLTDDVMALQIQENQLKVIPSFPQSKLSPEAAVALGKDPATLAPLFAHSHKRSFTFVSGFQTEPLPLKKLYILSIGNEHEILPISPREAFAHLVSHTRAIKTLPTPEARQKHLQQCTQLLEQVPCYRFIRKPGLSELPDLVRLVTNHANDNALEQPLPTPLCPSVKS